MVQYILHYNPLLNTDLRKEINGQLYSAIRCDILNKSVIAHRALPSVSVFPGARSLSVLCVCVAQNVTVSETVYPLTPPP